MGLTIERSESQSINKSEHLKAEVFRTPDKKF